MQGCVKYFSNFFPPQPIEFLDLLTARCFCVVQKQKGVAGAVIEAPNWVWTTMKSANTQDGIITCSRVCWPISFCGISRTGWKKKAPALTISQVRRLLEVVLPLKIFQPEDILRLVADLQQRNHRAYLVHRKRRLRETLY